MSATTITPVATRRQNPNAYAVRVQFDPLRPTDAPQEYYDEIKRKFAEARDLRLSYRPEGTNQYTSDLTGDLAKYEIDLPAPGPEIRHQEPKPGSLQVREGRPLPDHPPPQMDRQGGQRATPESRKPLPPKHNGATLTGPAPGSQAETRFRRGTPNFPTDSQGGNSPGCVARTGAKLLRWIGQGPRSVNAARWAGVGYPLWIAKP